MMDYGSNLKKMCKMSHMHGSNHAGGRGFFQKRIAALVMDPVKVVLDLRKSLINIRSQLDLSLCALLDQLHPEPTEFFQVKQGDIVLRKEPGGVHHQSLSDDQGINLIRLGLADVILPQGRRLDRVNDTNLVIVGDKEFHKVVAVMGR